MSQPAATTPSPRSHHQPAAPASAADGTGQADAPEADTPGDGGTRPGRGRAARAPLPDIDVERAAATLAGVARRTRVVAHPGLSRRTGVPVWLKCEHEQHTRSFKLRGAYNRVANADPAARARGLVAASAGNHAQGGAFTAARFGVPSTIFVPAGANPVKVARTRRWGAKVRYVSGGVDAALAAAEEFAAEGGRLLVHPFDDPAVIAGQGTIGLELLEQVPGLRTVLVGVGGGGLVTGIAAAFAARGARVRVIGVQAEGAPAFARSFRAGHQVSAPAQTIADGMAVRLPGRLPVALGTRLLDDVVTVDEAAFWEAMVLLARTGGHEVEPAGAAGVAALLRHPALAEGPTAVVLSGGNIDLGTADRVAELASATAVPAARTP
ncbi:MAG: pyridoxal-phosphate dependent enzyme [Frankia sp.]|nr:pyridoxal-phosphate dependent enzyme [Frankia sp.]